MSLVNYHCNRSDWVIEHCEEIRHEPDPAVVTSSTHRHAIEVLELPWQVRHRDTGIEMVLIPPGSFRMGRTPSQNCRGDIHEDPVHEVRLTQPFYMGRYPVTVKEWMLIMGSDPSHFRGNRPTGISRYQEADRPVEQVSWHDVQQFLSRTQLRLPSEAEWEYAYRAGTCMAFHGTPECPDGTDHDELAQNLGWIWSNSQACTWPVGRKSANGFGLHDMVGNVGEWVGDWYGPYPHDLQVNPTGPEHGSSRVVRGSSSHDPDGSQSRASWRGWMDPKECNKIFGFRVAFTASREEHGKAMEEIYRATRERG